MLHGLGCVCKLMILLFITLTHTLTLTTERHIVLMNACSNHSHISHSKIYSLFYLLTQTLKDLLTINVRVYPGLILIASHPHPNSYNRHLWYRNSTNGSLVSSGRIQCNVADDQITIFTFNPSTRYPSHLGGLVVFQIRAKRDTTFHVLASPKDTH